MKGRTVLALVAMAVLGGSLSAQDEYRWNASLSLGGSVSGGDDMGDIGVEVMREIGFPLESGNGTVQYRYTGKYREELRWTEEIIDQVNHSVYSAGIEPKVFLGDRGAVTLAIGYLATGPIRTELADNGELNGFWGRIGYSVAF